MTRSVLLASLIALAACHPPSLKTQVMKLGHNAVAIVKPTARGAVKVVNDHPELVTAVTDIAVATAQAKVQAAVDQNVPVVDGGGISGGGGAPARGHYNLRGKPSGGKTVCETYDSMESCNAACSQQQQAAMSAALDHGAGVTTSCACTAEAHGC